MRKKSRKTRIELCSLFTFISQHSIVYFSRMSIINSVFCINIFYLLKSVKKIYNLMRTNSRPFNIPGKCSVCWSITTFYWLKPVSVKCVCWTCASLLLVQCKMIDNNGNNPQQSKGKNKNETKCVRHIQAEAQKQKHITSMCCKPFLYNSNTTRI